MRFNAGELRTNPNKMMAAVREIILENPPETGINDLCRLCLGEGIPITKPLVSQVRTQLRKMTDRTSEAAYLKTKADLLAEADRRGDGKVPGHMPREAFERNWDVELEREIVAAPLPKALQDQQRREKHLDAAEQERERKRLAQEAREAKWAARAKEKEAEWDAARKVEEAADTAAAAPPLLLTNVVPQEEPVPAPVLVTPPPPSAPRAPVKYTDEAGKKTTAGMMMRRQYVNELLDTDPGLDPTIILGKVKEKFGMGTHWAYVYDTCRVARELHGLPQIQEYEGKKTPHTGGAREALPTFPGAPANADEEQDQFGETPEEECKWLARQAGDIMRVHGLVELKLTIENGLAKWTYVAKGAGEMKL